ncbi:MAG: sensor histidine kinase [Methylibium sp.]|nr:sensor histidine kinase [Methylibium sp.]
MRNPAPIELPRVVMRGALAVTLGGLLLALLLGLWRARDDMREETDAAVTLARAMAVLSAPGADERAPAELLQALRWLQTTEKLRHLRLQLYDAQGRALLPEHADEPPPPALGWLVALNQRVFPPPPAHVVEWPLPRPGGEVWRLQLHASPDSEQREALEQLLELLGLLALGSAVLLAVMHLHLRRAFRPLRPLLDAIARIERQELAPLRGLPPMPIRELDAIATALRHLSGALEQAEEARRGLARQVLTLQEDERSRLARELHDEFGQHLTALRVDAAWLQKRLVDVPELAAVVAGMGEQCARIQQEVRGLLTRLRPLGLGEASFEAGVEPVLRLRELLATLVQAWAQSPGQTTRYTLDFECAATGDNAASELLLSRELVLTVYRISQEALTNVARHANARNARLGVRVERDGERGLLQWSVEDDGRGLDAGAWQRGNGLAGVKERVWAAGGDLEWRAVDELRTAKPGLRLDARLPFVIDTAGGSADTNASGSGKSRGIGRVDNDVGSAANGGSADDAGTRTARGDTAP